MDLPTAIRTRDPVAVKRWLIENPHNQINIGYLMLAINLGNIDIVNYLLDDPRVDPSVNDNHAYDYALYELDNYDDEKWEVLELLKSDPRVQSKLNLNENKSN